MKRVRETEVVSDQERGEWLLGMGSGSCIEVWEKQMPLRGDEVRIASMTESGDSCEERTIKKCSCETRMRDCP